MGFHFVSRLRLDLERYHVHGLECWEPGQNHALIVSDGDNAKVLDYVGADLDLWRHEWGLDFGFILDPGVWVWSGGIVFHRDSYGEEDSELDGNVRPLTEEEWELFQDDEDVLDENQHLKRGDWGIWRIESSRGVEWDYVNSGVDPAFSEEEKTTLIESLSDCTCTQAHAKYLEYAASSEQ